MKKIFLILSLLIFSCEPCDDQGCGCGKPGIEMPSWYWHSNPGGIGCDCTGNVWDCLGVCGGTANNDFYINCDGECISIAFRPNEYDAHNGWCDNLHYACDEHDCDSGDCGDWNGYECVGGAAIKYSNSSSEYYDVYINSNDPSFPSDYIPNHYYEAIAGTYSFEYVKEYFDGDVVEHSGYYTTYNPINDSNVCFDVAFISGLGIYIYEWHPGFPSLSSMDCTSYFGYSCEDFYTWDYDENNERNFIIYIECEDGTCARSFEDCHDANSSTHENISQNLSNNKLDEYNKQLKQYNQYLNKKELQQNILDEQGISMQNSISNVTIIKVDNPIAHHKIIEIDSDPNVIVQEGKHYIMKYVKREIVKNK